jgi:hypothetical protein
MRPDIRQKIYHLCSYITDRSAVVAHINREYATSYDISDIAQALTYFPATKKRRNPHEDCLPLTPPVSTHDGRGYDPLAIALFKYHAERTEGEEKKYWQQQLAKVF